MISILDRVQLTGLQPPTLLAMMIVNSVADKFMVDVIISSVLDGRHSRKSLHYVGYAFDVDVIGAENEVNRRELRMAIESALTPEYDVIDETTHIHIEFQPKWTWKEPHLPHT